MLPLSSTLPVSTVEPVTEVLHGVAVTDPYRWLEDQDSQRTREWISAQTRYARSYLDNIVGRTEIRERIRKFLDIETYDSFHKTRNLHFFRKRLPGQEQPSIYVREGSKGPDQLLIDPAARATGKYTAVKPRRVSPSGRLLLYEVKQGGERTGSFEIFDLITRSVLPDVLPRGYLRGFAFAWDEKSFYYVHEPPDLSRYRAQTAFRHVIGTSFADDRIVFSMGGTEKVRVSLLGDQHRVGFLASNAATKTLTSFYIKSFDETSPVDALFTDEPFSFGPVFRQHRIFGITDRDAPNRRIVELRPRVGRSAEWVDIVRETDARIRDWIATEDYILVSYLRHDRLSISVFDLSGYKVTDWPDRTARSLRFLASSPDDNEVMIETQSFIEPPGVLGCSVRTNYFDLWGKRKAPFDPENYAHTRVWFRSKDGTRIPMFLLGRREVVKSGCHPAIMTSYGGYGVSMVPQFSVFVAYLVERGCLFALPNIRGGSEFGAEWHEAARRSKRQTAYDDFLAAAESLIETKRTTPSKLVIFGGSNSGLLVGAALTQRPELFRAVVCMVPMLDMLRYHLFDGAYVWREEFGTAEDPDDFNALLGYSPYHQVRDGVAYPATLLVSGDRDQNCNALHARKMTARLQASSAGGPVLLDYSEFRGHSPVLPLSDRIEALTDRMAFLSEQLGLTA